MPFPTTGQECGEDCSVCNFTAEECIDGLCAPDVGNQCAELGKKFNRYPQCRKTYGL